MATQRYVSTSFWDDEWVQCLDPSEKLLFLYLMTNPLTNIAGIYKITIRRMCFDTGFNADTVGHILSKFEKAGKAFLFEGWMILPNWPKYQKIGKDDNNKKGIDAILKSLPEKVLQFVIQHGYSYKYIEDIIRGLQGPYKTLTSPLNYFNLNSNLNSNLNHNNNPNNTNTPTVPDADAPVVETLTPTDPVKKPKAAKTKALVPKDQQGDLYQKILKTFETVSGQFANYGKEGAAIKRIIKLAGDEPTVGAMLHAFYQLTKGNDRFWSRQPYTPSALLSLWDRVKVEAQHELERHDVSWIDELEATYAAG